MIVSQCCALNAPAISDADYNRIVAEKLGTIPSLVANSGKLIPVNARPGSLNRLGDSDLVQVVVAPWFRPVPIFATAFDAKLVGMWVKRASGDGTTLEDGILLPDGSLWQDRREDGTQRFDLYFYRGVRWYGDSYWDQQGLPSPSPVPFP